MTKFKWRLQIVVNTIEDEKQVGMFLKIEETKDNVPEYTKVFCQFFLHSPTRSKLFSNSSPVVLCFTKVPKDYWGLTTVISSNELYSRIDKDTDSDSAVFRVTIHLS